MRFVTSDFFADGLLSSHLLGVWRLFEFCFEFGEIITIFYWLSAVIYSGESIFPLLFTTESCDSQHNFGGESPFVSNICINFCLLFNTESQYSPWVTTPRLIYSGESLLTAESYFQKLWRTPPSFKGTMKQKMDYPCRVLLTKNI
jgi:hypothetical protein